MTLDINSIFGIRSRGSNPPIVHLGTEVGTKSPEQLGIMNKKGPYDSGY